MTLFITEGEIAQLVTMDDALEAVEEVFAGVGRGEATNIPRIRAPLKDGTLRITAAVLGYRGYYGVKVSSTTIFDSSAGRVFSLYKEDSGELCAIVQVFAMGALRTGAASGVATRHLANEDASVLGVIGTGRQARTQVEAVCRVRPIAQVKVFSRDPSNREEFCASLSIPGVAAVPVQSPEQAVRDSHVVVTATTSTTPVLEGDWLAPGTHVNAVGANYEHRRELDSRAVARASVIATDDPVQVRYEATDLAAPVAEGLLDWDRVVGMGAIVAKTVPGRAAADDITLFKSLGVAIEDVALAAKAYELAIERGVGTQLPDLAG